MTTTLSFEEIEKEGTEKLAIAKLQRELQAKVDHIFPGYKVVLAPLNGSDNTPRIIALERDRTRDPFLLMTQVEQITEVLKPGPMPLRSLFAELQRRGSKVSLQSLMSILSAGRKADKFRKAARGIWGLPKDVNPPLFEEEKP